MLIDSWLHFLFEKSRSLWCGPGDRPAPSGALEMRRTEGSEQFKATRGQGRNQGTSFVLLKLSPPPPTQHKHSSCFHFSSHSFTCLHTPARPAAAREGEARRLFPTYSCTRAARLSSISYWIDHSFTPMSSLFPLLPTSLKTLSRLLSSSPPWPCPARPEDPPSTCSQSPPSGSRSPEPRYLIPGSGPGRLPGHEGAGVCPAPGDRGREEKGTSRRRAHRSRG